MKRDVLIGSIKHHILRLALPSIGGMFAITLFNLTDTYFVSKLEVTNSHIKPVIDCSAHAKSPAGPAPRPICR